MTLLNLEHASVGQELSSNTNSWQLFHPVANVQITKHKSVDLSNRFIKQLFGFNIETLQISQRFIWFGLWRLINTDERHLFHQNFVDTESPGEYITFGY